jgi:uncharacterized protein YkwD
MSVRLALLVAAGAAVVTVALAAVLLRGNEPAAATSSRDATPLLPGLPPPGRERSRYPANDPWKTYLADDATCPGGESTDLPLAEQANVMVCLVDYARRRRGLSGLSVADVLNTSALAKADRIVRCRQFAHDACGEDPAADATAAGYRGAFGENLDLADGGLRAPRVALDGWLNSPGHRRNLFRPEWRIQGIAVREIGHFGQYRDAVLWVDQFGTG